MSDPPITDRLKRALDDREYLADIFLILHLDESSSGLPPDGAGESPKLHVPRSLDEILMADPNAPDDVLELMLLWAREDTKRMSAEDLANLARTIRRRYSELREARLFQPIDDEADPAIAETIAQILQPPNVANRPLTRMFHVVRTSVVTLLSASRRTGKSILMRGRDFIRLLRDRITQLDLPSKWDNLAERKEALFKRLYPFRGGKGTKVFVGIAVSVGGIWITAPPMIAAGIVLAVIDP